MHTDQVAPGDRGTLTGGRGGGGEFVQGGIRAHFERLAEPGAGLDGGAPRGGAGGFDVGDLGDLLRRARLQGVAPHGLDGVDHHKIEAAFKAMARALGGEVAPDGTRHTFTGEG